jgi:predicted ester cyclase
MTLLDTYNSFIGALATGQLDSLPAFVDPDAYTETCVGLTGWTQGLDVALANFQYGIGAAFADLNMDVRDIVQSPGSVVIRARVSATHAGTFLGIDPTGRRVVWDSTDMVKPGPDGRIAWRFSLNDWEGVRRQLLGEPAAPETPVRYAVQAPTGHPLARAARQSAPR